MWTFKVGDVVQLKAIVNTYSNAAAIRHRYGTNQAVITGQQFQASSTGGEERGTGRYPAVVETYRITIAGLHDWCAWYPGDIMPKELVKNKLGNFPRKKVEL